MIAEPELGDEGNVRLRVNPQNAGPAPRIYFAEEAPVSESSAQLKENPYVTNALRVSFLICDVSGQYETGDPVTWSNKLVLRNQLSEIRPRVKGETTIVDGLIVFAVNTANQCLVPQGIPQAHWDKLSGAERFYLKLLDMEARGAKTLDNYQNFAKAFKVRDFKALLASQKANDARLKTAVEFERAEMSEGSELHQSVLRAVLYAVMELVKNVDGSEVLAHLTFNIPDYYSDMTRRELAVELAGYLAKRGEALRPDEASAARVLSELVKNQRLG